LYGKKIEAMSATEDKMVKDTILFKSEKIDYILERAEEFPKLFIFAAYTAQVETIAKALKEVGYPVRTVTGDTTDRATVFKDIEAAKTGIVVVQAAICEGYRVPSAPSMILASKSREFVQFDQGKGRILDGQHLKKNLYIHLVVKGGVDEDAHETIMSGKDFQEKLSLLWLMKFGKTFPDMKGTIRYQTLVESKVCPGRSVINSHVGQYQKR